MVRQVLSHWMFEHIHPVADGNGRIGRLLVPIILRV
jgi:Fic family protein